MSCSRGPPAATPPATMSDDAHATSEDMLGALARRRQEDEFMRDAVVLLEKSASEEDAILQDSVVVEADRFEERSETPEAEEDTSDEDGDELERRLASRGWSSSPSVKDQAERFPESVRLVDPETKILDLSNPTQLAEYNRLQKESSDVNKRKIAIAELERQQANGTWQALVTFYRVEYRTL